MGAADPDAAMLTVIIPTRDSERGLVQTLSPLVAGATAGLVTEVIVADAGSRDATEQVAGIAGCRFVRPEGPLGARLGAAAALARTPWLLFLRPGTVPVAGWVEAVVAFVRGGGDAARFRPAEPAPLWHRLLPPRAHPAHGLLIRTRAYKAAGGHPPTDEAEAALLRRLGRVSALATSVAQAD
jgi:hypothetical protein